MTADAGSRSSSQPPASGGWTVGILAGSVLDEYQNTVLFGANDELRERGASVILFAGGVLESSDASSAQRNILYDQIDPKTIDALIILVSLGNEIGASALSRYCTRFAPLPICTLSGTLDERPNVLVDNVSGMRELVQHLVDAHGKKRIAFVRGPVGNDEAERRFRVYQEVLQSRGIAFDETLITMGDFNGPSGAAAVAQLCDERDVSFDALLAANDYMAIAATEALQSRGFDVPGDIAVAGFDDIDEARFATPPLTTVRQPLYESGRQAARTLAAMLSGRPFERSQVLETRLVLRDSCGCALDAMPAVVPQVPVVRVTSLADWFEAKRGDVVGAMIKANAGEQARMELDTAMRLFEAFVADLRTPQGDRFVVLLDALLRGAVVAGASVRGWHGALSVLSAAALAAWGDPAGALRSEAILHRARVLVADVRERVQAQHRIRRERWIRTLHDTSASLMTAFGPEALADAIAAQLPRLRIQACAVSLYDRSDGGPEWARPLVLYDEGKRLPVRVGHGGFRAAELAPKEWLNARPRTLVAEPLAFGGEELGLALFEVGPHEGVVYEGLRELLSSAIKGTRLVEQVVEEATRRQRAERERLQREMEIATQIQTMIVPKAIAVPGLDIAAKMIPAAEVGGDYYDVITFEQGCWLGVGDVAGHGLKTGVVMLMIQSIVSALVRQDPAASPADILHLVNAVLYDNVRRRMDQDEHATLSLFRYDGDGQFVFAGAHEDIVIYRGETRTCECIETRGPWVGAFPDVRKMLVESKFTLGLSDLMVLYTDGVTEGKDTRGVQFGLDRVCAIVERVADQPAQAVRDHLVAAVRRWTALQEDDTSVLVVRRTA